MPLKAFLVTLALLASQSACLSLRRVPFRPTSSASTFSLSSRVVMSRRDCAGTTAVSILGFLFPSIADASTASIAPCANTESSNCVSTASVRQVDLYMPPWTIPDGMSTSETMARLKGALASLHLPVLEQEGDNFLRVQASRRFSTDELQFIINAADHVITFRSQQLDGPAVSDFGANRKRLEDIRKAARVFGVMGEDFETADTAPREGALGQLKAFYGLGSGQGYEDVILED